MKEKLKQIIDYYGLINQQRKLQEEVFELQEAITRLDMGERDYNIFDTEHLKSKIAEELADVLVVLMQLAIYYDFTEDRLKKIMDFKINRTLNRMEE